MTQKSEYLQDVPLLDKEVNYACNLNIKAIEAIDRIHKRIDYVVNTIARLFKDKVTYWDYDGEDINVCFIKHLQNDDNNYLTLNIETKKNDAWLIARRDKKGELHVHDLLRIPMSYLYSDNFEEKVKRGIELYKQNYE